MKTHLIGAIALSVSSLSAQWAQVTPAASPGLRNNPAMCTGAAGDVLMFGGDNGGFPSFASNQTWSYNGTTWTQLTPAVSPPGTVAAEMVYDSNRGVYVTYGGGNTSPFGGSSIDKTWEFDGTNWTQPVIVGGTPGGLAHYGMSFDSVRNKVVVFGGAINPNILIYSFDTWEWDGTSWTMVTTAAAPVENVERPAMCFHEGIGKTVLFGGIFPAGTPSDSTWLYDGTNWTIAPIVGPKPTIRTGCQMAYDSVRGVCVLTGGQDPFTGNPLLDTWEFDGATWTKVSTNIAPGRIDCGLAFSPNLNRMVQYGGVNFQTFTYFGDTWHWETGTFGSGCVGANGTPALSVSGSPRLGQSWTVTANNVDTALNSGLIVFGFTELPGVDLGPILGMTGCSAYTTPDVLTSLQTGAAGSFSWSWPSVSGSIGDHFFAQALCLDTTVAGFPATISNAISITVGN